MRLDWKRLNWSAWWKTAFGFWLRRYKLFFLLLFVVVSAIGGYQWRHSLFVYRWSEEERRTYLEATVKETAFDEQQFLRVLDQLATIRDHHAVEAERTQILFPGGTKKEGLR